MKIAAGINAPERKWLGMAPLFDPKDGVTILTPDGEGPGHWKGACSALYDHELASSICIIGFVLLDLSGEGMSHS